MSNISKQSSTLPLIIGLLAMLAMLLGACDSGSSTQTVIPAPPTPTFNLPHLSALGQASPTAPGSAASASPTAAINPGQTTPTPGSAADTTLRQELTNATDTMNGLTSFHAVAQTIISGTNLSLDGDFSANGSQFKGQRNGTPFTAIFISQTGYISSDGGKVWMTDTTNTANYAGTLFGLFNGFSFSATDVVSDAGHETLAGNPSAHKVTMNDSANNLAVNFWIVDNNGKKAVARVTIADNTSKNSITVDYSKYNEVVNVAAPKLK